MEDTTRITGAMDHFLSVAKRKNEKVDVALRTGVTLTGTITGFDQYSILLDAHGVESLIYKSSVSAIRKFRQTYLNPRADQPVR